MSIKPIFTEHKGWTGVKFERDGEAELAGRITTTDRLQRLVRTHLEEGIAGHTWLDEMDLIVLNNALTFYWSILGEEAKQHEKNHAPSAVPEPQP